ncbi:EAL domain-containing protein [Bacillaceae bacterium SIJ1]|uniref:putative bifunctional diguanylate cyclase/phosphodiesterase n=1 Tax=Litoribacterium kuwaitense TaxID=1398745 RepID=UPI0013EB87EA|nr:EAL domain-containing protein [Litoribacterium kuwaitense]NGP44691.1 EAL domain-containing protein [Litoribacterium kuwaitense]
MPSSMDQWLFVLLSFIVAFVFSHAVLHISSHLSQSSLRRSWFWIARGALTLGFGHWAILIMVKISLGRLSILTEPSIHMTSMMLFTLASLLVFYLVSLKTVSTIYRVLGALGISISLGWIYAYEMNSLYGSLGLFFLTIGIFYVSAYSLILVLEDSAKASENNNQPTSLWLRTLMMSGGITGIHYVGASTTLISPLSPNQLQILVSLIGAIFFSVFIMVFSAMRYSTYRRTQSRLYEAALMSSHDAVIITDEQGTIISWNHAAKDIFGYESHEVSGKPIHLILPDHSVPAVSDSGGLKTHFNSSQPNLELEGKQKNGQLISVEMTVSSTVIGQRTIVTRIIRDISVRLRAQKKIQQLVYRDDLTNLPNRRLLHEQLDTHIRQATKNQTSLAVMFIDLDRFKNINDVFGHKVGDKLLIEVSHKIQSCLRPTDVLARLSGDEFVVVLIDSTEYSAGLTAKQIIHILNEPIKIDSNDLYISASAGLSMFPGDGINSDHLLKAADLAMYRAKKNGKDNYEFFTHEMNEEMSKKLIMENGLRRALATNEFELFYQPQVNSTMEFQGVEALLRWQHPEYGLMLPGSFISLAEETGLILPIGEWVLEEACRQAKAWQDEGHIIPRMCVNISSLQFQQRNFAEIVERTLQNTGLAPHYLELELTESIVQRPEHAVPLMQKLKALGVRLSLDDFGTGYSSLSYLKDFPLDTLKVDRSFIKAMNEGPKNQAIVNTIINMANSLNINVIAEGVETFDQLHALQLKACEEYQGYLFSTPLASDHFIEKLQKGDFLPAVQKP